MKKILLTKNNYKEYISKGSSNIYVDNNMILTAGAKDEIRKNNLKIVYGEKPEQDSNLSEEEILKNKVIEILKQDHNVTDEQKVDKVIKIVLKIVLKNK
ncbi:hypothetical protein [Senegalia massiliensis]|uniref:hypothetical protein n=1 Tax=Senegalia massiliensis TaxID=1720316 RepID=UPI00102FF2E4|nr:hypothetical protein [Senegalia massiliensis]